MKGQQQQVESGMVVERVNLHSESVPVEINKSIYIYTNIIIL